MRIRVRHKIALAFQPEASSVIGVLRLTPRNHSGQHVIDWSIDVSVDCRLRASEDAFGNAVHGFQIPGPIEAVTVEASGEVELFDTTGFVRDAIERFPADVFLRDTPATTADQPIRAFVDEATAHEDAPLGRMHALMGALHKGMALEADARPADAAGDAFKARKGAAPDITHVFIAGARHLGLPARYVAGHALDAPTPGPSGHGWAEVHVDGYGWIAFDPALNLCPVGRHVRGAVGLDLLGAAPLRSARGGFGDEAANANVTYVEAGYGHDQ